jgi:hypothetical protein
LLERHSLVAPSRPQWASSPSRRSIGGSPSGCRRRDNEVTQEIDISGGTVAYDLQFRALVSSPRLSWQDFVSYFSGRPNYKVSTSEAWYANDDSGVAFGFELVQPPEDTGANDDHALRLLPVSFHVNYFRPHPFALEAVDEVSSFVLAFDLMVSDPQVAGGGTGEFSRAGFLHGWNARNERYCRALLAEHPTARVFCLPSRQVEAYWRWNLRRKTRQSELGDKAFVPRVFFFDVDGDVRTGVAWGDGIAMLFPVVDLVIVPRRRLAPRRLLRRKDDMIVLTWSDVESIVRRFPQRAEDPVCYELFYEALPPDIERLILAKEPPVALPRSIPFDSVLDQEVVASARNVRS